MSINEERKIIEDERNRFSKEIHDGVAQNLTALGLNLQFCSNLIEKQPEKAMEVINNCLNLINETAKDLKYSIFEPAALANLGLMNFIKKQVEDNHKKLICTISVHGTEKIFTPTEELFLGRIFSELLIHLINSNEQSEVSPPSNRSLDILFEFSAMVPFMLLKINEWDIDNYNDSIKSENMRLYYLLAKSEVENLKVIVTHDNNNTNIKINL